MGAEEVSGLGNLLNTAIQRVYAAGQEIHNPAGQCLVYIFHVQNNGFSSAELVSGLGGIVKGL